MITKTELTDEQMNEVYDAASELMCNVDEQVKESKGNGTYSILITKAVEDYVFENDYNQEQERELAIQVGL